MFDLTGKHVCYVADCGGIALETSKVLMTKNIAVSWDRYGFLPRSNSKLVQPVAVETN